MSQQKATTLLIWTLSLGGTDNEQKITQVASKNSIEKVHSQGRVLADRSVLYKYINPNLVAVITEGPDSVHKCEFSCQPLKLVTNNKPTDILNAYLVDVVSGNIIFSMNHRRAKGPVKIVHSENWLVYSFYNEKIRRNEISKYISSILILRGSLCTHLSYDKNCVSRQQVTSFLITKAKYISTMKKYRESS